MSTEPTSLAKVTAPRAELSPSCNKVVFGHWAHDLDRDQLVTYFFARFTGMLAPDAQAVFTPHPSAADIQNSHSLVIEGIGDPAQRNNKQLHNFDNGPHDEPAAYMLYEKHQDDWKKHPDANVRDNFDKLTDLARWIRGVDTGQKPPTPKTLQIKDLEAITPILYGLKEQHVTDITNSNAFLDESYNAILTLFDTSHTTPLAEAYQEAYQTGVTQETRNTHAINEHLRTHPEATRATTTLAGIKLGLIDLRGANVSQGGLGIGFERTGAEVLLLVDDEMNDVGQRVGARIQFSVNRNNDPHDLKETRYLQTILAPRLNNAEALFGKGYQFTTNGGYEGHPGIIGSNALGGSNLDPEKLWTAIQEHFDAPRHTLLSWINQAQAFASIPGVASSVPDIRYTNPDNQHHLPEHTFTLAIESTPGGERTPLTIREIDLALYQSLLTADPEENRRILLTRSSYPEPDAIVVAKEDRALTALPQYIREQNAGRILDLLDNLRPNTVAKLDPTIQITLLKIISRDDKAIDAIWNQNNNRFTVKTLLLPPTLGVDPDTQVSTKFFYESVPSKIDRQLMNALLHHAVNTKDLKLQQQLGNTIIATLENPAYQDSHQGVIYDSLLQNALTFITHPAIAENIRTQMAEKLVAAYPNQHHWEHLAHGNGPELAAAKTMHPQTIGTLYERYHLDTIEVGIPGVPNSSVRSPDINRILAGLAEQPDNGLPPTVTVLTETNRVSQGVFLHHETERVSFDRSGQKYTEPIDNFAGIVSVPRPIDIRVKREHILIANTVVNMVDTLLRELPDDVQVRIVRGGYPNELVSTLTAKLIGKYLVGEDGRINPEGLRKLERIVWGNFDQMNGGTLYDSPFDFTLSGSS